MILDYLRRHAEEKPLAPFLADETETLSFRETDERAQCMGGALERYFGVAPGSSVYIYARDSVLVSILVLATQYAGARVCILNREFGEQDLARVASRLGTGILITDAESVPGWPGAVVPLAAVAQARDARCSEKPSGAAGIVILTTGTTGTPKAVFYVWERLFAQTRTAWSAGANRWALLYPLNHFAGLQVFLHVIRNGLFLAIPRSRQITDVFDCLIRHEVDSASATPTFWRMFAAQADPGTVSHLRLAQITLGGEPVTGEILERLHSLFPAARLTHIYATTELGACFAVSDGLPGFPVRYLDALPGNVRLKVGDGQLYVRSSSGMVGYVDGTPSPEGDGDWIATGDFVAVKGERVHFLGRKGEIINVGGIKVYPPSVEEQIRRVHGVRDVRVYGKPNAITGQLVAADIEISDGAAGASVLAEVRSACRTVLSRYEQPRELHIVEGLARSNEKLVRT